MVNPCCEYLIQHPTCLLDINPSKYIKIYTSNYTKNALETLPKQELLKISLFAPLPVPAPNSIVREHMHGENMMFVIVNM